MTLHALTLIPELLFNAFSFLDLPSIRSCETLNKNMTRLLASKSADHQIYGQVLFRMNLIPSMNSSHLYKDVNTLLSWFNREQWDSMVREESKLSFRSILKELFHMPFTVVEYTSESYRRYGNKGGVAEIHIWKPCVVIRVLLKHFHEHFTETFNKSIHQFLVALSVNGWECDGTTSTMTKAIRYNCSFSSKEKPVQRSRFSAVTEPEHPPFLLSSGAILIGLLNDFEKLKKIHRVRTSWRFVVWALSFNTALDFKLMHGIECDGYNDIFDQSKSPPYGMRGDATVDIEEIRLELYGEASLPIESYDWASNISDSSAWSNYWHSGLEWWGCHCISSFNVEDMNYVVGSSSTTD